MMRREIDFLGIQRSDQKALHRSRKTSQYAPKALTSSTYQDLPCTQKHGPYPKTKALKPIVLGTLDVQAYSTLAPAEVAIRGLRWFLLGILMYSLRTGPGQVGAQSDGRHVCELRGCGEALSLFLPLYPSLSLYYIYIYMCMCIYIYLRRYIHIYVDVYIFAHAFSCLDCEVSGVAGLAHDSSVSSFEPCIVYRRQKYRESQGLAMVTILLTAVALHPHIFLTCPTCHRHRQLAVLGPNPATVVGSACECIQSFHE